MPDFFTNNLLEASFRGIGFPVTDFRFNLSQDLAQHKRPDQDGAFVEATGRNPITFQATIPFVIGLAKGSRESWSNLYPEQHGRFLAAMADRSKATLVHPSFGAVTVKPVSAQSTLTADRRNGEMVEAEWVEASESQDESTDLFGRNSIGKGLAAAVALDSLLVARPQIKKLDPDKTISLSEAFNRIVAVFDTASLLVRRALGRINALAYRINTLHRAVVGLADPKTWEIRQRLLELSLSLRKMKALGMGNGTFTFYVVPKTMTIGELATFFNVDVKEIIELNPFLINRPVIERGEVVRRYKRKNVNDLNRISENDRKYGRGP